MRLELPALLTSPIPTSILPFLIQASIIISFSSSIAAPLRAHSLSAPVAGLRRSTSTCTKQEHGVHRPRRCFRIRQRYVSRRSTHALQRLRWTSFELSVFRLGIAPSQLQLWATSRDDKRHTGKTSSARWAPGMVLRPRSLPRTCHCVSSRPHRARSRRLPTYRWPSLQSKVHAEDLDVPSTSSSLPQRPYLAYREHPQKSIKVARRYEAGIDANDSCHTVSKPSGVRTSNMEPATSTSTEAYRVLDSEDEHIDIEPSTTAPSWTKTAYRSRPPHSLCSQYHNGTVSWPD